MNPRISIVIPVFQESAIINDTLTRLPCPTQTPNLEIIVIDGDSAGATLATIQKADIIKATAPKGRSFQMNRGASLATGNILLFLHADTKLPENALDTLRQVLNRSDAVAGAFELGIDSPAPKYRIIEIAVKLRTHFTKIPYGDQAIFINRLLFKKIGGYPEVVLMEDIALMQRVKQHGGKIVILPSRVRTSARRWEKEGVFYCTLRNWLLVSLFYCGVSTERLKKFY